jgi:hypothetical protein
MTTQAERFSTAPQGNVTQTSHKYETNGTVQHNATKRKNFGEAEQSRGVS